MSAPGRRSSRWVLLATVVTVLVTARLGWWQLGRADEKLALQSALARQRDLPPLTLAALPTKPEQVPSLEHRSARLQGRWSAEHTLFLDNRTMDGRAGFYVVTPLMLDGGAAVLVQRGFVPRDPMDRQRVHAPAPPAGRVDVVGRVERTASHQLALGAESPGPIRQNLDVATVARESRLGLLPFVLVQQEAAGGGPLDGLARHWPVPTVDVQKHYGYAFQWFALSALAFGLYVWFQLLRPRLKRPTHAHPPSP